MLIGIVLTQIIIFFCFRHFMCLQQVIYFNNNEKGLKHLKDLTGYSAC